LRELGGKQPAGAHTLDEYLEATIISVENDRVQIQIRVTPGVAVFPIVPTSIGMRTESFQKPSSGPTRSGRFEICR